MPLHLSRKKNTHIYTRHHLPTSRPTPLHRINPHPINKPIRLRKRRPIPLHMCITRRLHARALTRPPHIVRPGPLPAQRRVEHDIHVLEMRVNVAGACVVRHRGAPAAWVGGAGGDVCGDGGAGKEVDGDVVGGPFCGVDAAADGVETGAEGVRVACCDRAAGVLLLALGVGVAVCGVDCAGHAGGGDGAAGAGV